MCPFSMFFYVWQFYAHAFYLWELPSCNRFLFVCMKWKLINCFTISFLYWRLSGYLETPIGVTIVPVLPLPIDGSDNGFPISSTLGISLVYQKSLTLYLVMIGLKMCLCVMALGFEPNALIPKHTCIWPEPALFFQTAYLCPCCAGPVTHKLCYRVTLSGTSSVAWHSPLAHQFPCHWF